MGTTSSAAGRATFRRRLAVATAGLVLAAGLIGLAGCGGSDEATSTSTTPASGATTTTDPSPAARRDPAAVEQAQTFRVGRIERTLVDDTRPTAAHGGEPELPSRTLPTLVLYPALGQADDTDRDPGAVEVEDDAEAAPGPRPLIVFGHGSTRAGPDYLDTLAAWASAGYVVAAPNFPLSTTGVPGGTDYGGIAEQAGDVSFTIDQVLAASADEADPLHGTVDPEHIGLGGQSFGAITAISAGFDACCADPRVDAVTAFAGIWLDTGSGEEVAADAADRPALFVHGDADPTLPYEGGRHAAELVGPSARFLTLVGGSHDGGFFGGLGGQPDELVTLATLAFYDAHLKGDPTGEDRLADLVADAGPTVASLGTP